MHISTKSFTLLLLLLSSSLFAQKNVTTVGLQYKPIFPVSFVGTGVQTNDVDNIHFETGLSSGFSAGMVIRHCFSDLVALEGGINYVKRKYSQSVTEGSFKDQLNFQIIGYEIPVSAVIFARLGEKLFANGSLGPSCDMFPTSIVTYDNYISHVSFRNHIFNLALNGNVGFEYRTEKSGNLYLGVSYHRPFEFIYFDKLKYTNYGRETTIANFLVGNYLTIDFRYFFHEDPIKKGSRKPRVVEE
jgi:hypothetical protein